MSIWKKMASLLFEESDADIIAEDELADISFAQEEKVQYKQPVQVNETQPLKSFEMEKKTSIVEEAPVKEEPKKFVSIEVSEQPKEKENVQRATRSHISVPREEKVEFEFSPVISPIFGSKEEVAKSKSSSMSITLPKPKKQNPLGTVISPYYGLGELEEFEAEAQEKIEKNERSKMGELTIENLEDFIEEEDVNSLSLDDLIMVNDIEEDEDDMMQISLFGESTPLRESDEEVVDK